MGRGSGRLRGRCGVVVGGGGGIVDVAVSARGRSIVAVWSRFVVILSGHLMMCCLVGIGMFAMPSPLEGAVSPATVNLMPLHSLLLVLVLQRNCEIYHRVFEWHMI